MKSLLFTLTAFFVSVFGILALDKLFNGTLTGRGLAGSLAVSLILTGLHCYRSRRSAAERKREERLARRAGAHRLVEMYRKLHNERGEGCGGAILICMAVIGLFMLLVWVNYSPAAECNDLDQALTDLTAKYQPEVLLTVEEFAGVRDLTTRTAILISTLQAAPPAMPAALQNRRTRVRVQLEKIQEELLQLTVDHAGTRLRRLPRVEAVR